MHVNRVVCLLTMFVLAAGGAVRAQTPPPAAQPALLEAETLMEQDRPKDALVAARRATQEDADNPHAWFVLARAAHATGDYELAIDAGHRAAGYAAVRASAYYNLACAYAQKGSKDEAFRALTAARRAGFADRDLMAKDADLESLRSDPRFTLPLERNYFVLKLKDGSELAYSVDLPVNFDPRQAYPVLIAPGHGKKVEGNWGGLFWGEDTSQRGWITVESPAFLMKDPLGVTPQLLDEVARRYRVEGDKFHFACYGPAAGPAFAVAMAHPERVKSITAVPGFPVTNDQAQLAKLKGIKVSFIVGQADTVFLHETELAYARLQKLGVETFLEVIPATGHLLQPMFGGEVAERLQLLR